MSSILVTGASTGIGLATASALLDDGHDVVVHARTAERLPPDLVRRGARPATADLGDLAAVAAMTDDLRRQGRLDAVVHNAGVMGGADLMTVNVLAPYLLSALLPRPGRIVLVSSSMHRGGTVDLDGLRHGRGSYSDSKLLLTTLALALTRRWPEVVTSAVDPGWVPTRMGGAGAPDPLDLAHVTQTWLATSDDPAALEGGGYWFHQERSDPDARVLDTHLQDDLLDTLAAITGTPVH